MTCRWAWNWSARPRASRTSRSALVSRASSTVSHFTEGIARPEGTGALPHRSEAAARRRSPTPKADLATAQARLVKTQNDVKRLTPLAAQQAVSQQELDNAVAARERRAARRSRPQSATVDTGPARPRLHDGDLAHRRPRRHDAGEGRQPRRARREHAADDGVRRSTRFSSAPASARPSTSASRAAPSELRKDAWRRADPDRPRAGRRHRAPAEGPARRDRARRRRDDGHADRCSSGSRTPAGSIRPGQYGRARFVLETRKGALLVPQRAVQELQNLYNVAVVGSRQQGRVQDRHRRPARGQPLGVESGLERQRDAWSSQACSGCAKARSSTPRRRPRPPSGSGEPPSRPPRRQEASRPWPASSSTGPSWRWCCPSSW